jgi:hypothetical protein
LTHHGPDLGEAHHLPPYSILCVAPPRPRPNGFFSRDSQSGVSKLSRFGLSGLWAFITSRTDLRLGQGRGLSHSTCTHRDRVDSRLFVVGNQTASLTPGPSFDHNLCCICPNRSCKAISDIYTSRPFQRYKKHLKVRCFDPCNRAVKLWESRRVPSSHFRECESHPHTYFKVGSRHSTF